MSRPVDREDPDRLYTVTRGRSRADDAGLDLVTLIVRESDPTPGLRSEYVRILRMCEAPTAVVEIASALRLPVIATKILLRDLLDMGMVTARHPRSAPGRDGLPDPAVLRRVLSGLENL
ncbi:DUF742 domain-containing protein [Gandjariella thermophila]|uniref:DUF742 domain-containing protein n=1 Tax=Gandjariella thermophila TaxID=1931992 RepID=A0A4D4JBK1_9PSEU|nr:DUF742 domain-containing protein [Gandjariella thermophila]GDY32722.1 hypothetical protein GTS_43550 [Gandjariella thermophila]